MKMKKPKNGENLPIRNSTAEFLIFAKETGGAALLVSCLRHFVLAPGLSVAVDSCSMGVFRLARGLQ